MSAACCGLPDTGGASGAPALLGSCVPLKGPRKGPARPVEGGSENPLFQNPYFELNASKKQSTQEDLPGLALPDKRHVSVCGGVYPFHLLDQEGEHHRHHWREKAGVKMRSVQTSLAKITLIFCKLPPVFTFSQFTAPKSPYPFLSCPFTTT